MGHVKFDITVYDRTGSRRGKPKLSNSESLVTMFKRNNERLHFLENVPKNTTSYSVRVKVITRSTWLDLFLREDKKFIEITRPYPILHPVFDGHIKILKSDKQFEDEFMALYNA
tara:strand:- start:18 stop:359 length:342 start_codon:yes stop_codon:yes gene_type:complete